MKKPSKFSEIPRVVATGLLSLSLVGCGGDKKEEAAPALRVGDLSQTVSSLMQAAGEDKPEGYGLEWANFVAGAQVITAAVGGSLDVGFSMETPLVFAQAAGGPVKVVAAITLDDPASSGVGLGVAANSDIRDVADLKGKKVFYLPGSIHSFLLAQWLEQAGLTPNDVVTVNALAGAGSAAELLKSGAIDAAVLLDLQLLQAEKRGDVRVLAGATEDINIGIRYLLAPEALLADEATSARIADFVARLSRAHEWQNDNPDAAAAITASLYRLSDEDAKAIGRRSVSRVVPIDEAVIASQQRQADTFYRLGLIRAPLDVRAIFDDRYNPILENSSRQEVIAHDH